MSSAVQPKQALQVRNSIRGSQKRQNKIEKEYNTRTVMKLLARLDMESQETDAYTLPWYHKKTQEIILY